MPRLISWGRLLEADGIYRFSAQFCRRAIQNFFYVRSNCRHLLPHYCAYGSHQGTKRDISQDIPFLLKSPSHNLPLSALLLLRYILSVLLSSATQMGWICITIFRMVFMF